jgi:hypothetical protein
MAASNYVPGTWLGIVRSRKAVLLGSDTPPELVHSLWELLEDGPEVHELLHAVTSSFGVSLAQIPPFGIADFQDSLRVFLRGDLDLTVQLSDGPVELNGRDVTTWAERSFAAPEWCRLTIPGGGPSGQELPLQEGVVLLQSLTMTVSGTPAKRTPSPALSLAPGAPTAVPEAVPHEAVPVPAAESEPVAGEPAAEPEDVDELVPVLVPEPEFVAPEDAPAPGHAPEYGASAETVLGINDDDADYEGEAPESWRTGDPGHQPEPAVPAHDAMPAHDAVPAHELTGSYDHLWDRTVIRSIEDAAVRADPEADDGEPAHLASARAATPATPESQETPETQDAPAASEASATGATPIEGSAASSALPAPPAARTPIAPPPSAGGLIDSVPWNTGGGSARSPQAEAGRDAAMQEQGASFDPDHDGHTIMKSDLTGMTAHPAPAVVQDAGPAGPLVLARICGQGHANPPTHAQCAACGLPLPSDAVQVARPRLGRMRVSTGELVDLDQSLVIGRQPSVSRVQGGVMPRLVQVASPSGDISRSHVEVRLEGWHVMLCDLKATNGTVLVRGGQQPRRLAQNEMAILLDGDIAELGDDISLRFEEIL